jgi:hypothetical protein
MNRPDEERRAALLVASSDALDAHGVGQVLDALGIHPDVFRIQWSRTVQLDCGWIRMGVDVDLRKLSVADAEFLGRIVRVLHELDAPGTSEREVATHAP